MPIVRRSESPLATPLLHFALGRMEAEQQKKIQEEQFDFEEAKAIAQAVSDFSADQKHAATSAAGGAGSIMGTFMGGGLGGGGGGEGGGGGVSRGPLQGGAPSQFAKGDLTTFPGGGPEVSPGGFFQAGGQQFDMNTQGGRAVFKAISKENFAGNRFDERILMEGIQSGALQEYGHVGFSAEQQGKLASLQNARQQIVSQGGSPGFKLSPFQQNQAMGIIDSQISSIQPEWVAYTPQERAARSAPTPTSVSDGAVTVNGSTRVLDRNGTLKEVDNIRDDMRAARESAIEQVEKRDDFENMGTDERNQAIWEQQAIEWISQGGDPEALPPRPSEILAAIGASDESTSEPGDLGPIKPMPDVRDPKFNTSQLVVGGLYETIAQGGERMVLKWTGKKFTTDLEADDEASSAAGSASGLIEAVSGAR